MTVTDGSGVERLRDVSIWTRHRCEAETLLTALLCEKAHRVHPGRRHRAQPGSSAGGSRAPEATETRQQHAAWSQGSWPSQRRTDQSERQGALAQSRGGEVDGEQQGHSCFLETRSETETSTEAAAQEKPGPLAVCEPVSLEIWHPQTAKVTGSPEGRAPQHHAATYGNDPSSPCPQRPTAIFLSDCRPGQRGCLDIL